MLNRIISTSSLDSSASSVYLGLPVRERKESNRTLDSLRDGRSSYALTPSHMTPSTPYTTQGRSWDSAADFSRF